MRPPIRSTGRSRLAARLIAGTLLLGLAGFPAAALGGTSPSGDASSRPSSASAPAVGSGSTIAHAARQAPTAAAPVGVRSTRPAPAALLDSSLSPCALASGTWSCDLWARTGSLTLPDTTSVTIWGYAASSTAAASIPGPTLIVTAGNNLSVTLHNVDIPNPTSLGLSELPMVPDTTGVAAGSSRVYTVPTAGLLPGTYLYEAGLTPDGPRQVAMGLAGALVVRPADCGTAAACAYGATTAFDDEGLVFLSEVDPAFNASEATFDLGSFAPKYWLINGKAFPQTTPIATDAGRTVLLRYVNGGLEHHPMSLLGLHETIVADDGRTLTHVQPAVDDTIAAGETVDALVAVPGTAPAGTRYALFDAAMHMDNNGALVSPPAASPQNTPIAFGGMLTFLQVAGTTSSVQPPVTTAVTATPSPTGGSVPVALSATISSAASTVAAAEYFVDALGLDGAGCSISGTFGTAIVAVSATIPITVATAPCAGLATLASGSHTLFVHGRDATGAWGTVASAILVLDKTGPSISGATLTPSRTNGNGDVSLTGTASDDSTGGANVTAAEYFIDPSGTPTPGTGTSIPIATPASTVALAATIPAATVVGLADGTHTIAIEARDAIGNWGAQGSVTLTIDKTAPGTSAVSATPNPTNGLFGVQIGSAGQLYERIDATVADPIAGGVNSSIVAAEYFIDTVGAAGTGGQMLAADGTFNSSSEAVVGAAELYAISALSSGPHTIYVRGKDAAGNWGPTATATLVVDKTRPFVTTAGVTPNPTAGATTVTLNLAVMDVTPINRVEYFVDTDPGLGNGTAVTTTPALPATSVTGTATLNISGLALGTHTVSVRARNTLGNWSSLTSLSLNVTALFADGFDTGNFSRWSATSGASRLSVTAGAQQAGGYGMAAQIVSGASGYVQNNTPLAETTYNAAFYLNPNGITLTNNTPYTLFTALNNTNATRFSVLLRRSGTQYQVGVSMARTVGNVTSTLTSGFTPIGTTGFTRIEAIWTRVGTALTLRLFLAGGMTAAQTLAAATGNAANTATYRIDTVRLGPQGSLGGASGTLFLDTFVSTRTTVVGP